MDHSPPMNERDEPPVLAPAGFFARHPKKLLALAVLVLLGVVGFLVDAWAVKRLRAFERSIRSAGEPLTMAEIEARLPTIPDAENMAIRLFKLASVLVDRKNTPEFREREPLLPMVGSYGHYSIGERLPAEVLEAARTFLLENQDTLAGIHAATALRAGRYPELTRVDEASAAHRAIVRIVLLESLVAANEGRSTDAFDAMRAVMRSDCCLDGPTSVFRLLRQIGTRAVCASTMADLLCLTQFTDAQLAEFQATLFQFELSERLESACRGERVEVAELAASVYARGSSVSLGPGKRRLLRWFPAIGAIDSRCILEMMSDYCHASTLSATDSIASAKDIEARTAQLPAYCVLAKILVPSMTRTFELFWRARGDLSATRAAVAAERFRLRYGRWPDKLDDLVPEFLAAVPSDPWDDKPIRYQKDDSGIRVWSIGEDCKDDGGEVERYTTLKKPTDWGRYLVNPDRRARPAASQPAG